MVTEHEFWVLHSPYPDGSWRGLEKCCGTPEGDGPLLFDTKAEAEEFIAKNECDPFFVPVLVTLQTPSVRAPLSE